MADQESTRCPNCHADVSVWAGHCPSCGAPLPQALLESPATAAPAVLRTAAGAPSGLTSVEPPPVAAAEPSPVEAAPSPPPPPPARTRRARWWRPAVAVLVGLAVFTGILVSNTGRHRSPPAGPSRPSTTTPAPLLDPRLGPRTIVEADRGQLRAFKFGGYKEFDMQADVPGYPNRILSVSGAVVYTSGGTAYAAFEGLRGKIDTLGPADRVIASSNPGQVWLVRGTPLRAETVQLACVGGCAYVLSPPIPVPKGFTPVAPAAGQLVLTTGPPPTNRPSVVWNPFPGRVTFTFPQPVTDVIDTHDNRVAWMYRDASVCRDGECSLHVTDVSTGADRVVAPPPGHAGYIGGGAFSAAGGFLAAFVSVTGDLSKAQPVIIHADQAPGTIVEMQSATMPVGEAVGAAEWAPTDNVLFVGGLSGTMLACLPGSPTPISIGIPPSYTFAVI